MQNVCPCHGTTRKCTKINAVHWQPVGSHTLGKWTMNRATVHGKIRSMVRSVPIPTVVIYSRCIMVHLVLHLRGIQVERWNVCGGPLYCNPVVLMVKYISVSTGYRDTLYHAFSRIPDSLLGSWKAGSTVNMTVLSNSVLSFLPIEGI